VTEAWGAHALRRDRDGYVLFRRSDPFRRPEVALHFAEAVEALVDRTGVVPLQTTIEPVERHAGVVGPWWAVIVPRDFLSDFLAS
jgi:hypothetical protein